MRDDYDESVDNLDDFVNTLPRPFADLICDAQAMTPETPPGDIEALVLEALNLSPLELRRLFEAIKKSTGMPLSVLKEVIKNAKDFGRDPDQLALARNVITDIGAEQILSADSFVWCWDDTGVWRALDDRTVKQLVQQRLPSLVDDVSRALVDAISDLLKTEIHKPGHQFNTGSPETVNCLNGELCLVNGEWQLMPHTLEHYRTTQIPVAYDATATAPRFTQFLTEIFAGDDDAGLKAVALLEMMGYTLMAHCRYEMFIILVGSGANGKSVWLAVLEALCGPENVAGVQPSQFDRSFQRAHLHAKLANIVTEIKQGEVIDDASLKGIVSGEPTTVEHKFKDPFVMRPFSTCWFGTNHMPHTRDFSEALFRRALVVQFNNVFKPELGNCDPRLKDDLIAELPGILNMALSAYAKAVESGFFTMPASCEKARHEWRMEADQVAQFVEEKCRLVQEPKKEIPSQQLFNTYLSWAKDAGIHKTVGIRAFGDRLEKLGCGKRRDMYGRYITGIETQ